VLIYVMLSVVFFIVMLNVNMMSVVALVRQPKPRFVGEDKSLTSERDTIIKNI
jgi:hypothetical protein